MSVIPQDWGVSASEYVWMLNNIPDIYLFKKKVKKMSSSGARYYCNLQDWGVSAGNFQKKQ
jgi:hypothetical protein